MTEVFLIRNQIKTKPVYGLFLSGDKDQCASNSPEKQPVSLCCAVSIICTRTDNEALRPGDSVMYRPPPGRVNPANAARRIPGPCPAVISGEVRLMEPQENNCKTRQINKIYYFCLEMPASNS